MAKKTKKTKKFDISDFFDLEEKKSKMPSIEVASTADIKECISSGFLSWDLVVGGGYQRGMAYQIVGPEYAGKSTGLFHSFSSALRFIPNHLKGIFIDVEGLDPVWFGNICKCKDIKKIFGKRDEVTHKWIIKPQVRHYKPSFGEQGLKFLKRVLKRLPNKVLVGNYWYYVWEPREPKKVKKTGGYTATELRKLLKGKYSKKLYTKYGNYCVPIKDNYAGPEILIGVDSWAAMTPESIAEDDSGAMAQQARMFGKHLNDIKSLISAKGCTMIGTNQVRQNPGQRFGNPEYNPGGNTLKHITDCRIRVQSVANQNGKGLTELEGTDEYRWFKVKTIKNKLFIPYKESKGRWWIGHGGKSGFGADIVQDTLEYLKMTGQFRGRKKGFQIKLVGKNKKCKKVSNVTFTYDSFKKAILNPGKVNIRELCFKQLRSGRGMKLYSTGSET
jgi:RecA/RadA recombinase